MLRNFFSDFYLVQAFSTGPSFHITKQNNFKLKHWKSVNVEFTSFQFSLRQNDAASKLWVFNFSKFLKGYFTKQIIPQVFLWFLGVDQNLTGFWRKDFNCQNIKIFWIYTNKNKLYEEPWISGAGPDILEVCCGFKSSDFGLSYGKTLKPS